ncbi:MAG TPA: hypothetical protein VD866_13910, partial [Urbifossiella sp.]|nr:hypothetical protein [Urbifossiella sp.]
ALVKTDTATIKQLQTANAEITKLDREMKSLKDLAGEVRSTSQEVRKLAIEQAQLREDARNNRADKMALDTRLAAVEKQLQGKEATAAKQKQQFEALVPTVRDRKQVLIATVAEADSELKRLRGADKAGDDKTTDEHAVDRWLSTKTWVEVNTARHRDMKVQLDGGGPGGRLPVQQHNAVWKEWRDLGVELEKSPRRVSELERRVSPEANQAVMGATRKRDEAVRELEELRSRR